MGTYVIPITLAVACAGAVVAAAYAYRKRHPHSESDSEPNPDDYLPAPAVSDAQSESDSDSDSDSDRRDLITDNRALDLIAEMLRDPIWGVGMLEDIGELVTATGRSIKNYPDDRSTWGRH